MKNCTNNFCNGELVMEGIQVHCSEKGSTARPLQSVNSEKKEGDEILWKIYHFLGRFVAYPDDHSRIAHTLWVAHTYFMDIWDSTPRIAFLSPEPSSGKTRALEVTASLVPRPIEAVNVSSAYLFRKVGDSDEGLPTILYDEIDTVFGQKTGESEEKRGLLNAGHRRGAKAGRCVNRGNTVKTEEISAFCAVAFAGIGSLPDTLLTRCINIKMKRRSVNEKVESWRIRIHVQEGQNLGEELDEWAQKVFNQLVNHVPELPPEVADRDADVWESLIAIADIAGGQWPDKARVASVAFVARSKENTPSLGVRLLSDLKGVFGEEISMHTEDIIRALNNIEEAPWNELNGFPLSPKVLAKYLNQYGIKSRDLRLAKGVKKGYRKQDMQDAWNRYLKPLP